MRGPLLVALLLIAISASAQGTISPAVPIVNQGATLQFTCTANCGTSPVWTCTGTDSTGAGTTCAGSITVGGLYTAPATVNAQQSYGGYQLLPNNHIFNTRIDSLAVDSHSAAWIAGAGTVPFSYLLDIPNNFVDASTPTQNEIFLYTPGNNGTFQIPAYPGLRIQCGALVAVTVCDRHLWTIDTTNGMFQEIYNPVPAGTYTSSGCPTCTAASGVRYSNSQYPLPSGGVTASGNAMMPVFLRAQEVENAVATGGTINHAITITLQNGFICNTNTANACGNNAGGTRHIWPATAEAFSGGGIIPYGARFRLKSSFNISSYSSIAQVLLKQLQQYGVVLTDGGTGWQSGVESTLWPPAYLNAFNEVHAALAPSNFEAVDESSLMISTASGECTCNREIVTYTSSTGTASVDVVLQGVTVNMPKDVTYIQSGTPAQQLTAYAHGGATNTVTWSMTPSSTIQLRNSSVILVTGTATTVSTSAGIVSVSGDFVHVSVQSNGAVIPTSITDTCGNTYTRITASNFTVSSTWLTTIWYSLAITGCPSNIFTALWPSPINHGSLIVREYSPNGATISLDVTPAPTTSASAGQTSLTSGSFTTTGTNEVIIATFGTGGATTFASPIIAGLKAVLLQPASGFAQIASEDLTVTAVQTTITASASFTSQSGTGVAIVTFKGTGGNTPIGTLTSGGLYTPPTSAAAPVSTTVTATSTDNGLVSAVMTLWVFPTGSMQMRPGATLVYMDTLSNEWINTGGDGGWIDCCGNITGNSWPSVPDIAEYYFEQFGPGGTGDIRFDFTVPNGTYQIRVKLATDHAVGDSFDTFEAQGTVYYLNIDPNVAAGGTFKPIDFLLSGVPVTNGQLSFVLRAAQNKFDTINALQIVRTGDGGAATTLTPGVKVTSGVTVK